MPNCGSNFTRAPQRNLLAENDHFLISQVKFWDFNTMDTHLKPFRSLTPMESHGIRTIRYSAAGDMVLIAAGNAQVCQEHI